MTDLEKEIEEAADLIANVTCPQCKKAFVLCWNDYEDQKITLLIRGCPSGGVYDVSINCPFCDYEEPL